MTDDRLDPRVRSLLEEALEQRDLDVALAEQMIERTQRLKGEELEDELRTMLREA